MGTPESVKERQRREKEEEEKMKIKDKSTEERDGHGDEGTPMRDIPTVRVSDVTESNDHAEQKQFNHQQQHVFQQS